jgi:hypothetical protein
VVAHPHMLGSAGLRSRVVRITPVANVLHLNTSEVVTGARGLGAVSGIPFATNVNERELPLAVVRLGCGLLVLGLLGLLGRSRLGRRRGGLDPSTNKRIPVGR